MITKTISILNLNVPCYNHCKHCLLSWNNKLLGIDYERSVKYARSFFEWLKENHPNISFIYYFGYSMEHPKLFDVIKFCQETNSPSGRFLQFDGMKKRNKEELKEFILKLKEAGIELLDFTFYGTKEFHDKFAGRSGDYELMMDSIDVALKIGINLEVGIVVTKNNLNQLDELVNIFELRNIKVFLFTPHSQGRGKNLIKSKISIDDYNKLSDSVKKYFNRQNNKTQREWKGTLLDEVKYRSLQLSLLESNIEKLEKQSFEETFKEMENNDEIYYSTIPSFKELLIMYCDESDNYLYSKKDLYLIYRKKFIKENNIIIDDISDERFSGSVRF